MHVKGKSNSDTSNNRVNWNHPKIIQTVPQQHTEKSGNYKMHPYWALHNTLESTNVKLQNIFNM